MEGERAKEREGGSGTSGEGGREEVSLPLSVPLSLSLRPSVPLYRSLSFSSSLSKRGKGGGGTSGEGGGEEERRRPEEEKHRQDEVRVRRHHSPAGVLKLTNR